MITGLTPKYQAMVDAGRRLSDVRDTLTDEQRAMVERNIPLAFAAMGRAEAGFNLDVDDRRQTAIMGVIKAALGFDASRGVKFATYASHAVYRHLVRTSCEDGVIRTVHRSNKRTTPETIEARVRAKAIVTLPPDEIGLVSREPDPMAGEDDDAGHDERCEWLREAFARLDDREQFILRHRYMGDEKMTLEAIGRELGVTKERVRQLETKAIRSLRLRAAAETGRSES